MKIYGCWSDDLIRLVWSLVLRIIADMWPANLPCESGSWYRCSQLGSQSHRKWAVSTWKAAHDLREVLYLRGCRSHRVFPPYHSPALVEGTSENDNILRGMWITTSREIYNILIVHRVTSLLGSWISWFQPFWALSWLW
jgi:hypothetical protein